MCFSRFKKKRRNICGHFLCSIDIYVFGYYIFYFVFFWVKGIRIYYIYIRGALKKHSDVIIHELFGPGLLQLFWWVFGVHSFFSRLEQLKSKQFYLKY